jgi:hypothetical protein
MSTLRKVHISLTPENFQAVRRVAFESEISVSEVIDDLIAETLMQPEEPPAPPEPEKAPLAPPPSAPLTWSVTALRNR